MTRTVEAIARYFHTDIRDLGWLTPLSSDGHALMMAITGGATHLTV